jgi:FKBP-type peptidyl-prolyl cis-trans isomerase SlyD
MDNHKNDLTVQDDLVVSMDFTLNVDGEVVDKSDLEAPVEFLQGHGNIIPGLERALYGMRVGESKEIRVAAAEGYGDIDPEAFAEIPRKEFPKDIPLKPGVQLMLEDEDGEEMEAYIVEATKNMVRLNLNHPLAGKELLFSVTIVDIREADEEELAHGHAHYQDEAEEDWEWEEGEE